MHTNRLKKIFAVILAAAMLLSITVIMTGCGDDKKDAKKETTAPTAAPTTATTDASVKLTEAVEDTQAEDSTYSDEDAAGETVQSTESENGNEEDGDASGEEKHGNITQGEAAQIALQNCEYGQVATMADPADYEGQDCWHVVVQDTAGRYYDCYVSSIFCEVFRSATEEHDYGYDDGGEKVDATEA